MKLGVIGLGRMGGSIAERLLDRGHSIVGYDRSVEAIRLLVGKGGLGASAPVEMVGQLDPPRSIWLMVPAGETVDQIIDELLLHLEAGDVVIDGGNSHYRDSMRRAERLRPRGIGFIDVGTSGGIWGRESGFCLMVGGENGAVQRIAPVFDALAPKEGWAHLGPSGSGHFAKMVHNAVEYGMLQAYGEGFELLKSSPFAFELQKIARLWNQGSVIRSWLLELAERAFSEQPELESIRGYVEDSGEGRWAAIEAVEKGVPATVLTHALFARFTSRQRDSFAARVVAALRREFGGHPVKTAKEE